MTCKAKHSIRVREIKTPHVCLQAPFAPSSGYSKLQFSPLPATKPPPAGTQLKTSSASETYPTKLSKEVDEIIEKLRSNDTTSLNIGGNNISDAGAKAIAEALKTNQTLTALGINSNNISAEGAKAIAEALKTNKTLTVLGINSNNISAEGAKAIAEALKTNKTLTALDINSNNISDAGAKAIAEALKTNQTLTKLLLFPDQVAKHYMHLVCSGHFKTLITYWERILLPGVFDQGSNYLYDFLLYVSPIFVALFLPDELAVHFLHYFIYIGALHFYENKNVLTDIENFFNYYYPTLAKHYGAKSQLCTIHLHLHLKEQVLKHSSLSLTSCFLREDYLGHSLKWCHGKKYVLEQFITWYLVNRTLRRSNELSINDLFLAKKFDERYLNNKIIQMYEELIMGIDGQQTGPGPKKFNQPGPGLNKFLSSDPGSKIMDPMGSSGGPKES
ncbi:unnamed protein product [Didymodactylos carnosus]|uniref:Uncharacterized protein n=1 Tax=Didymodactylos carnosus TaxID=1234261 RepID=A0A815U381_9BILA|nr:unnamed protein product [Didymodactylos carnosus]CAF4369616.1 unnamed protein product [Didymodactylos carnosus]